MKTRKRTKGGERERNRVVSKTNQLTHPFDPSAKRLYSSNLVEFPSGHYETPAFFPSYGSAYGATWECMVMHSLNRYSLHLMNNLL